MFSVRDCAGPAKQNNRIADIESPVRRRFLRPHPAPADGCDFYGAIQRKIVERAANGMRAFRKHDGMKPRLKIFGGVRCDGRAVEEATEQAVTLFAYRVDAF